MVTGGQDLSDYIDTTEVYDSDLGNWAISGAKLLQPMGALRATNIDGRVLIFGNCILFIMHIPEEHYYNCRWRGW